MGSQPSKLEIFEKSLPSARGLLESDKRVETTAMKKQEWKLPGKNFVSRQLEEHYASSNKLNGHLRSYTSKTNNISSALQDQEKLSKVTDVKTDENHNKEVPLTESCVMDVDYYVTNEQRNNVTDMPTDYYIDRSSLSTFTVQTEAVGTPTVSKELENNIKDANISASHHDIKSSSECLVEIFISKDNNNEDWSSDVERGNTCEQKKSVERKKKKKKRVKLSYTSEELEEKKVKILTKAKKLINSILLASGKIKNGKISSEYISALSNFSKLYLKVKSLQERKVTLDEIKSLKIQIGMEVFSSRVMDCICGLMVSALSDDSFVPSHNHVINFVILLYFTEVSPAVSEYVCQYPGFLQVLADKMTDLSKACVNKQLMINELNLLEHLMDLIYNIASVDSNIPLLRSLSFTQVLLPYLDITHVKLRLSAVSSLANIVDEDDCQLLKTTSDYISFILTSFHQALRNPSHKQLGWSAAELCRTVKHLARNDANKRQLVEEGCLPLLSELSLSENPLEAKEAFETVWLLSFDDDNKESVIAETDLMKTIVSRFEVCDCGELKLLLQGFLWTLRNSLAKSEDFKHIVKTFYRKKKVKKLKRKKKSKVSSVAMTTGQLMISYQRNDEKKLVRVRDVLKENGFQVWMDVDDVGVSTLQAMADAVDDSTVVVMCVSSKYKHSPQCRVEAEYAAEQNKRIIPLIMEHGYQPDGWLDIMLDAKPFHDFSGKYPFEMKMIDLLKDCFQLKPAAVSKDELSKPAFQEKTKDGYESVLSPIPATIDVFSVKMWSSKEVKTWLLKNNITSESLHTLTGKEVIFLKNVKRQAPEFYYQTLKKELRLKSINSIMEFTNLLKTIQQQR